MMAESLCKIASDKKRNAHFLQRMHEGKRIFRIGVGTGPKHGDLKREGFWKLLEWVEVSVSDVVQAYLFSSQGKRGLGGNRPNRGRPGQTQRQKRGRERLFQPRILRTFTTSRENMDLSMRHVKEKARKRKTRTYRARGQRAQGATGE